MPVPDFGIKMGLAFQLQDDYLDVYVGIRSVWKKYRWRYFYAMKTFMLINALALAELGYNGRSWKNG